MTADVTGKFWRDNLVYGLASVLAGIFNWLYAILLAHGLGPARYGVVVTLNNVMAVLMLPAAVVSLAATRRGKPALDLRRLRAGYGAVGVGLWLIVTVLAGPLGAALKVSPVLFSIFGLAAWPMMDYAANLGYLARARRYLWLGALGVAEGGLAVAAVLGALGSHYPLAMLGVYQATLVWVLWAISVGAVNRLAPSPAPSGRSVALAALVGITQSLMNLTDGVIAKARLLPTDAGLYNGLATVGQSVPFAAASLSLVMLTAMLDRPGEHRRWFRGTLTLYGILGLGAEVLFWRAPRTVVHWALGPGFAGVAHLLAAYGIGMLALGFVLIFLAEAVARGWWVLLVPQALGLAAWAAGLFYASNLAALVSVTARFLSALAVGTFLVRIWVGRRDPAEGGARSGKG